MSRRTRDADEQVRVRMPADMDRPDRILAGLTGRQLAILAAAGVAVWVGYSAMHRVVPLPLFGALAAPILVAALFLALGRRDGLGLDHFLAAAIRQAHSPRRLVPAPEGVVPAPTWAAADGGRPPTPLSLPPRDVGDAGTVDLGPDGAAVICQASAVAFALRTPPEQQALAVAFGRYLNSLAAPIQILVRSEPVDLTPAITQLREEAGGLPHRALEATALAHARFLADLAEHQDLLTRQVLLVLRDPVGGPDTAPRLRRRAEEATRGLAAAGVTVTALDGPATVDSLRSAIDPWRASANSSTSNPPGIREGAR
jgi:PrgI family protein